MNIYTQIHKISTVSKSHKQNLNVTNLASFSFELSNALTCLGLFSDPSFQLPFGNGKCLFHFVFDSCCNAHIACIGQYLHSLFKDVPSCLYF